MIVVSNLEYGGAQRQIVELANHIDNSRFDLHICSLSDYVPLGQMLNEASSRLHIVRKKFKFDVSVVFRLASLLKEHRVDIVHGYLFDAEIAARLAGRLAGTSVVGNSERNTNYSLKKRQLITYRMTRGLVDFCIANSQAGAEFNQRTLGNPPESYYTIHNGVDTSRFYPRDPKPIRASLGFQPDQFVIGMFGSFKEQKNHPLLFKAARLALDRYANVRILLVGDQMAGGLHGSDDYKRKVLELSRRLGLESYCVHAGNRDDVEDLYSACDVTALPSLFEGTPNVALESMACGVPIIATDVSDNAYIIRNGETGFVVPLDDSEFFADRLLYLLENDTRRRSIGHNARRWMEREFSCSELARKTESVYLDLVGEHIPAVGVLKSFDQVQDK